MQNGLYVIPNLAHMTPNRLRLGSQRPKTGPSSQAGPQASLSPPKMAPRLPKAAARWHKIEQRQSRRCFRSPYRSPQRPKAAHTDPRDPIPGQFQPQYGSSMQFLPCTSSHVRPCCQGRLYKFVAVSRESAPRSGHSN